jgi:DNA-directed RNA polymerase specialized sigma24 family protein
MTAKPSLMRTENELHDRSAPTTLRLLQGGLSTPGARPGQAASRGSPERLAHDVRTALGAGDATGAVNAAVRFHGAEVFGFLLGVLGSFPRACNAYTGVIEEVRRRIGAFRWQCSLRTWLYAIACGELRDHVGSGREGGEGSSSHEPSLPDPTTTMPSRCLHLETGIASLRRLLPPEDRALLILRVDRRLGFRELAITSVGEGASRRDLALESDLLRRRFLRIREELARAAVEHRILAPR